MRIIAILSTILAVAVGWWLMPQDDCATKCAKELAAAEAAAETHVEDDCDDGDCPAEDDGCEDCATCMCCASTAPAADVPIAHVSDEETLPVLQGEDSATPEKLRASAGFLPGVFKPPRA